MDAHDAHRVELCACLPPWGVADGRVGLATGERNFEMGDVVEEATQVAALLPFKDSRHSDQLVNVGEPPLAPIERERIGVVAGRGNRAAQQLEYGAQWGVCPLRGEQVPEGLQSLAIIRRKQLIELGDALDYRAPRTAAVLVGYASDEREPVAGEAHQRRGKRRGARPLVQRIGESG